MIRQTFDCGISEEDLRQLDDERGFRLCFRDRFKHAIKIFARVDRFPREIDYQKDPGWEAVWETFDVRDRLVHPKAGQELEIEEVELNKARAAFEWAHKIMAERVAHAAKAIDEMQR